MLRVLIAAAGVLAALPAAASSIEIPKNSGKGDSVTVVTCADCPPFQESRRSTYVVPTIAPNTDRTEIREVGGRMKVVRTEAWLGGSPILFMTSPTEAQLAALKAPAEPAPDSSETAGTPALAVQPEAESAEAAPGVDERMRTSALDAKPVAPTIAAAVTAPSHDFDGKAFQLRLK